LAGDIFHREENIESVWQTARTAAIIFQESKIPIIMVPGNHEDGFGNRPIIEQALWEYGGVHVLENDVYMIDPSIAIVGGIGQGGGFPSRRGQPEQVTELTPETFALRQALFSIENEKVVFVSHYSPIIDTLSSERSSEQEFMGSEVLEEMIDAHGGVTVAFHGHVHVGQLHGRTRGGTDVFNVAMHVLQKNNFSEEKPFDPTSVYKLQRVRKKVHLSK
jgi:Icc-related predicted phosphoesterase